MIQFKRDDYFNMGKWMQPTLPGVVWCYWSSTESVRKVNRNHDFHPMLILDGNFPVHKKDAKTCAKIVQEVLQDGDVGEYTKLIDRVGREFEMKHLDVIKSSSADIEEYLPKLFDTYQEIVGFWIFNLLLGEAINEHMLKGGFDISPEEMLDKLGVVSRRTWLEEQSQEVNLLTRDLFEKRPDILAAEVTEDLLSGLPELSRKIDEHVKEYAWFGTHHWIGEGYTRENCLEEIRDIIKRWKVQKSEHRVSVNAEVLNPVWSLLAAVAYWRTHCAEVTNKVIWKSRPQLVKCAEQWSITYDQLIYLSPNEIIERLSRSKDLFSFPDNYAERQEAYGCYLDEVGNENIVTGDSLQRLLNKLIVVSDEKVSELKGVVASKGGLITGRVTVLIEPKDFKKFNDGDILVAPETSPDFVPYMKKAVAIITDHGGITSHAAIVSRELGVPCIIGTRIATQVLKDGMTVSVDTNTGKVKIINDQQKA